MIDEKIIDKELQEKYKKLVETDNLLPIKISDFYMKKLIEEIDTIGKEFQRISIKYDGYPNNVIKVLNDTAFPNIAPKKTVVAIYVTRIRGFILFKGIINNYLFRINNIF